MTHPLLPQTAAAALCLLLAGLAAPAQANHLQTDSGQAIRFDHTGGNGWWVEVAVSGTGASSVQGIEVQGSEFRDWHAMEYRPSWGKWVWSGQVYGDAVRFRATWAEHQTVSCWFVHPSGTERCGVPMPTGTWNVQPLADAGTINVHGSVAVDVDDDGSDEVYVLGSHGLVQHRKDALGWHASKALAPMPGIAWTEALALTAGDANDDGRTDLYSAVRTYDGVRQNTRIYSSTWTGSTWIHEEAAVVGGFVDAMAVGDVDGDGLDELWVAQGLAIGRIDRTPAFWVAEHAASLPESAFGIAVGDADRDGDAEAWATTGLDDHADLWRIEVTPGGFSVDRVAHSTAGGARDVMVGDGDNDGQVEAYVMNSAHADVIQIVRFSNRTTGWTEQRIDLGPGKPLGLDRADGDGDGQKELYVSDWDGRLLQARWTGSAWSGAAVAQLGSGDFLQAVAVGDAEGDGKPEAYGFSVDAFAQPGTCCNPVTLVRFAKAAGAPPPPPPPPGFDATFTGVRGNEWWVQANVAASGGTVSKVDVRLNGGDWKPLAKQSWGPTAWAASYRITQGTTVQLRATSTAGATDESDCYRWIPPSNTDASKVECGSTPPPGFDASFTGVKGNEWWVQVKVDANERLSGVDARVNCGSWVALDFHSWGSWAKSFHIPDGSKVDFRARSQTGAMDVSGGYIWPSATPTAGC